MQINRRDFLMGTAASGATLAGAALAGAGFAQGAPRPLPVLPMMDTIGGIDQRISLNLNAAAHDFGTGTLSATYGINSGYLGPVVRVKQGQTLPIDVNNGLADVTTLHWHGLHIPGGVDGGPHQEVAPGETWSPDLPIVQHASMNWFHSHMHGKTARQTYTGLAGVMLIEDDASLSADLPKTYGIDDFTLVLQDKMFDASGAMSYELTGEVFEEGFVGDTLVVNGAMAPVARPVPKGLVRLRILNACNARFLTLSMASGPMRVIASDGGFLATTVETDTVLMSPGERYEVLVDMRSAESNSLMVSMGGGDEGVFGFIGGLLGRERRETVALTLTGTGNTGVDAALPDKLANLSTPKTSEASVTREFTLDMEGDADLAALALAWGNVCGDGVMGINGQPMKMDRIDEAVRKGDTEIWRITVDQDLHPFHIHGGSFRILSQNGSPPPAYAQGWKDMVHVEDGWSEVLMRFDHEAPEDAPYMYHCHILEHEDCGMMGQFTVT